MDCFYIFQGFTELTLIPTKDSFRFIFINCKQACVYKVVLNDTLEVPFQYCDPLMDVCPQESNVYVFSTFTPRLFYSLNFLFLNLYI